MSDSELGPATPLPTGTVTFLMSDVEGSTRRWEDAPEAMAAAIPRHYELLHAAIVEHAGVRPVEQGEGDSVLGAFGRASDAVAAAMAVQQAFAAEPWPAGADLRVRIAVHTGEARVRGGTKYLGPLLNRAARIRATGYGGQVLVSATTAALVADQLPSGSRLDDLGLHRLKDLGTPERIWQLVHPDLPSEFPPLRSLDSFRHNLPLQLTPLIGRRTEIGDVRDELAGQRLLTLTGSGGVGKTRLALAVAAELLDSEPGGVFWVELAPVADPSAVGATALASLDARQAAGGAPIVDQLAVALGVLPSLLVLDNCEHLVDACAELVAALLAANPAVTVLTTSREPLGVPGEVIWRVPSMRSPAPNTDLDVDSLAQYEAVDLFVERAHRARPSFAVSDANAPAIAEICHRLDGIPLALELAAARCRQLSPERIASELADRFRLLTGGARTVMARQRTLLASVDWSHERLDDSEQRAFRRLGVFSGPFPLEAAEAVVSSTGDVDVVAIFDLLTQLVDKSLVAVEEGRDGEPRFRMLETLRAYALDRAQVAGELTALRDAHAAWWADWLHPLGAMPTDDILEELDEFHAELRSALDWSTDDPRRGLRFLRDVATAWYMLGRPGDAMAAADVLLSDRNAERCSAEWLAAAYVLSSLYFDARGDAAAFSLLARIDAVATDLGDEYYQGLARQFSEVNPALRDLAGHRGDRYIEAWQTMEIAVNIAEQEPAAAAPCLLDAESVAEASGMRWLRDFAAIAHAESALSTGDLARTIELTRAVLSRPGSKVWDQAVRQLGCAALLARDVDALRLAVETADLALRNAPGLVDWVFNAHHRLALLEGQRSSVDPDVYAPGADPIVTTGRLWLVAREAIDAGASEVAVDYVRRSARPRPHPQAVRAAVDAAATGDESRWHDTLAIAVEQGLRLIATDAFEGLAHAAARTERLADCLRLLAAAQRLRDQTGYVWRFGCEQRAVDHTKAIVVDALGDDDASAAATGSGVDWRAVATDVARARARR